MTDLSILDGPLRRFSNQQLHESVSRILSDLPPDTHGAVVAIADEGGARLAAVGRLAEGWSVVGVLDRTWKGKLTGEAQLRFEW